MVAVLYQNEATQNLIEMALSNGSGHSPIIAYLTPARRKLQDHPS
jgi:hypothetical protein